MITKAELRQKLLNEWQYQEKQVDKMVEKIYAIDPAIIIAFYDWFTSQIFPCQPDYNGINPKSLSETYPKIKPPAIFTLLDWIRRDPQEAMGALYHEYHKLPEIKR
jgi:hypothetical protein